VITTAAIAAAVTALATIAAPATKAAAATTAPATEAATAAARALTLTRFIDAQGPAAEILTVQGADRGIAARIVHLNEPETARTLGLAIRDQLDRRHRTMLREQVTQFIFRSTEGQIAHEQTLAHYLTNSTN